MRKLTRTTLAATAVAGLLAIPVAGAGAADASGDTTVNMTLNSVSGTVSITVPDGGGSSVDMGDLSTGLATDAALTGNFGQVTVSDSTQGVVRTATVTTSSGIAGSPVVGFCQDDDGLTGGITCSASANTSIPTTAVNYDFAGVTESGVAGVLGDTTEVDGALGVANAVFLATTAGEYTLQWTPSFTVDLLGTEIAGEYYGVIRHEVTAVAVG